MTERYYINFCDDFNTERRISIFDRDFTGVSIELKADVNPFSVSYDAEDDFKFTPIRPSLGSINMIFGGDDGIDFEEFWTSDEKRFKVEVRTVTGGLDFAGFVIPNGFSYELKGGLYHASLEVSDGLGLLEAYPFMDDNLTPYGNQDLEYNNGFEFPYILIIVEILRKLDLNLDVWTCINSYESNMVSFGNEREADALSQAFVNVKTFINDSENRNTPYWHSSNDVWNCYEVLKNVLQTFGAKIYQENGVFKVVSIDLDAVTGDYEFPYTKYNSIGTFLDRSENYFKNTHIACSSDDSLMLEDNHTVSMNEAYRSFRMNYEYTFLRDGDTPLSLLKNGDFSDFRNTSTLAAPNFWNRVRLKRASGSLRIKEYDIAANEPIQVRQALGITKALVFGENENIGDVGGKTTRFTAPFTWLQNPWHTDDQNKVKQGDLITLRLKQKLEAYVKSLSIASVRSAGMYRLTIRDRNAEDENMYALVNANTEENLFSWEKVQNPVKNSSANVPFFYLNNEQGKSVTGLNVNDVQNYGRYIWYDYDLRLPSAPIDGDITIMIHGLGVSQRRSDSVFTVRNATGLRTRYVASDGSLDEPRLIVGAVDIGIIPNENDLPEQSDYIYNNPNRNFTLQVDPVTVYNGDTQNEKHVSNIIVPRNTRGIRNVWQDYGLEYGRVPLGLLTVQQIMRQYQLPTRILEGSIRKQNAPKTGTYTFDAIPNVRFVLHRGTFNYQKQYIEDATFLEVSREALPLGGFVNGNTLDPVWQATGNTYCERGEDNLNTGNVIEEQIDINSNSETFEETREVVVASDLIACPLGAPTKYYWLTDVNTEVTNPLVFTEIDVIDGIVDVTYTNTVDGSYLYFVYLKSLGDVKRVTTFTTPSNVLEDWIVIEDKLIDGFLYRVMRTRYVMTEFNNFIHNFYF